MKTINAQKITKENFLDFGSWFDISSCQGVSLNGEIHRFFPDRINIAGGSTSPIAFSGIEVKKADSMIIKAMEYHNYTPECILPLNDDAIIHVSPATAGLPCIEETKAFIVPKGTMVKINTGVWHLCPLPVSKEKVNALIILPERTYMNDCVVVNLDEKDWVQIV
ncbi:MAG: ureidoglycolate lyase [Eubacteriales bacterium]|nr:ureidoglycolate lyase [Eubacteriales bacterium]